MKIRQLSHVQIIALGFFLVIACGTALLMLPVASKDGESAGFLLVDGSLLRELMRFQ